MNTTFEHRQFETDVRALEAYHKFPDGKTKQGKEVPTITPQEFIEKYPQFFSSKTDPNLLPKTATGIASLVASSAVGAQKSIARDRVASKGIEAFIDNDEELKDIFNIENYSHTVKGEDEEGDETVYLQKPDEITKLIKDIAMVHTKYINNTINERLEIMKEDIDSSIKTQLSLTENNLKDYSQELVKTEAPKLMESKTQETSVKKIFGHYSGQILVANNEQNEVAEMFKALGDNEEISKIYSDWENLTINKFNNWNSNKISTAKYSPELIKSLVDGALSEVMSMRGKFLTEALPNIDMGATVAFKQQVNQQPNQQANIAPAIGSQQANVPQMNQVNNNQALPRSVGNEVVDSSSLQNKLASALGLPTSGQQQ